MSTDVKHFFLILFVLFASQLYAAPSEQTPVSAYVELLYWQLTEGSDENWSQNIPPKGAEQSIKLFDAPFKWEPGFRLGISYDAPESHWDTAVYYTNYQTNASNHASGDIYSAFLGNFFANNTDGANFGPFYDSANIKWDFAFHALDLELGRLFNIDRILTLRPFVGLKAALITQDINSKWYGPKTTDAFGIIIPITTFTSASEKIENNFWGVGPAFGVDSTWPLYESANQQLSIIANVSGALMWGRWTFSDKYQNNTPVTIDVKTGDTDDASTIARGVVGLEWSKQFTQMALSVHLAYEAQVWFDQVQYYNLNMGRLNNLMSLQGGNLGVRLNY